MPRYISPDIRLPPLDKLHPDIARAFSLTHRLLYDALDVANYFMRVSPWPPYHDGDREMFRKADALGQQANEARITFWPVLCDLTDAFNRLAERLPRIGTLSGSCAHHFTYHVAREVWGMTWLGILSREGEANLESRWEAIHERFALFADDIDGEALVALMLREAVEASTTLLPATIDGPHAGAGQQGESGKPLNRREWIKRRYLELRDETGTQDGIIPKLVQESDGDWSRTTVCNELKAIRKADPTFPRARDREHPGKRTRVRSNRMNSIAPTRGGNGR